MAHLHAGGWTITALPVTSAGTIAAAVAATELGPDVALVKIEVNVDALDVDLLSIAGHKC